MIVTCHCGVLLNLEELPPQSRINGRPGKHCPVCNEPHDSDAVEHAEIPHHASTAGRELVARVRDEMKGRIQARRNAAHARRSDAGT